MIPPNRTLDGVELPAVGTSQIDPGHDGIVSARPTLDLTRIEQLAAADRWLAVLCTQHPDRADTDVAIVNVGIVEHPIGGELVVGFVARPGRKVTNLRARPSATLVVRAGWEWTAVRGRCDLVGPDDLHADLAGHLARLRRDIYLAAGGNHPDLDEYDAVMASERRVVVLLHPERIWSNPPGAEHVEPQETHP